MSTNQADAFNRGSRLGKTSTAGRGTAPTQSPPSRAEKLVAAGIWLPAGLRERLLAYCHAARVSQAEAILRAVDYAADHVDQLAANPEPEPDVELTGGLFPRPQPSNERTPGRAMSIRFRSDHLTTLTRLASDNGLNRSTLIKLSLADYLDNTDGVAAQ